MREREARVRSKRRGSPASSPAFTEPEQSLAMPGPYGTGTPQTLANGLNPSWISAYRPSPAIGPEGGELSPPIADRIRTQHGGGAPLELSTRHEMEGILGHSFANVRIHADDEADALNQRLGARAFTLGSDIFLGREATSSGAPGTQRTLAHELTHVVQQRGTAPAGPLRVGPTDDAREREADNAAGTAMLRAGPAPELALSGAERGTIQRQPAPTKESPTFEQMVEDYNRSKRPPTSDQPAAAPPPQASAPPPQPTASASRGLVAAWRSSVEKGSSTSSNDVEAAPPPGKLMASPGDRVVVEAVLREPPMPGTLRPAIDVIPVDRVLQNLQLVKAEWDGGLLYRWELVSRFSGTTMVQINLGLLGGSFGPGDQYSIGVTTRGTAEPPPGGARKPGQSPGVAELAQEVGVLKQQQAATQKLNRAQLIDQEWQGIFAKKIADYNAAVKRISAAMQQANIGFTSAHQDQALADQLTRQIIAVMGSVVFSASFEWVVMQNLGKLRARLNSATTTAQALKLKALKLKELKEWSEKVENPANAGFGGGLTNVWTTAQAIDDAKKGQAATEAAQKGQQPEPGQTAAFSGDALVFFLQQGEKLDGHAAAIADAFSKRANQMQKLTLEEWEFFDPEEQANTYRGLLAGLEAEHKDVHQLRPEKEMALILERHLWAAWIKEQHALELKNSPGLQGIAEAKGVDADTLAPDALPGSFGNKINQHLIDIGVEGLARTGLGTHWYQDNADDWNVDVMTWARAYKETVAQ